MGRGANHNATACKAEYLTPGGPRKSYIDKPIPGPENPGKPEEEYKRMAGKQNEGARTVTGKPLVSVASRLPPNLLGSPRAESDPLLTEAFVQTPDYRAVTETLAYNFVVGRRGTGKSAIFLQARQHFLADQNVLLLAESPAEHTSLEFQRLLQLGANYRLMRAASTLCWSGHLLLWIAGQILERSPSFPGQADLTDLAIYRTSHRDLFAIEPSERFVEILRRALKTTKQAEALPKAVADTLRLADLQRFTASALDQLGLRAILLYDGLDEGWEPRAPACASLGGLARALSQFSEARLPIHGTAFVRDNMFRALFAFDDDFSRNIEGSTLRLNWDEASLLHLVANRLRLTLHLAQIEKDIRIWNSLVDSSLSDREGFAKCLENTLLRPRDILVLLNSAALTASRAGRNRIGVEDIGQASTEISEARLSDLLKEYEAVLPGLRALVNSFSGHPAVSRLAAILPRLDQALSEGSPQADHKDKEFKLLLSSSDAFQALFAVGFAGVRERESSRYRFCHDGSGAGVDALGGEAEVMVHPCYWKALDVRPAGLDPGTLSEVTDEEENVRFDAAVDIRVKQIGRVVQELDHVPDGREGSRQFEEWVHRILKILFSGRLENFELKPNKGAANQRDIIATITQETGFWARVNRDYRTRQLVVEVNVTTG